MHHLWSLLVQNWSRWGKPAWILLKCSSWCCSDVKAQTGPPKAISALPVANTTTAFHQESPKELSEGYASRCVLKVALWLSGNERGRWQRSGTHDWQLVSVLQPGTLTPLRLAVVAEDFSLLYVSFLSFIIIPSHLCASEIGWKRLEWGNGANADRRTLHRQKM